MGGHRDGVGGREAGDKREGMTGHKNDVAVTGVRVTATSILGSERQD